VIIGASRSRRQMIQRMGRVLRRKADHRRARFAVLYVESTIEDPAQGARRRFWKRSQRWLTRCARSEARRERSTPQSSFFVVSAVSVATGCAFRRATCCATRLRRRIFCW